MRKIQIADNRLSFRKERIVALQRNQTQDVQGGFTYSLSLGDRCEKSKKLGAKNNYACGLMIGSLAANYCEVSPGETDVETPPDISASAGPQ